MNAVLSLPIPGRPLPASPKPLTPNERERLERIQAVLGPYAADAEVRYSKLGYRLQLELEGKKKVLERGFVEVHWADPVGVRYAQTQVAPELLKVLRESMWAAERSGKLGLLAKLQALDQEIFDHRLI